MKLKFTLLTIIMLLSWGLVGSANAQSIRDNEVKFNNVQIERVGGDIFGGGDVVVNFQIDASKRIRRCATLILTPSLVGESRQLELPQVEISYKKARINRWRRGVSGPIADIIIKPGEPLTYTTVVKYNDWMNGSALKISAIKNVCANNHTHQSYFISPCITLAKKYEAPTLCYLEPRKEAVKRRSESGSAYIEFKVSKWDLLPNFANNSIELAKINSSIEKVHNNTKNYTITKLELVGSCSPEGSYSFNAKLAENRVQSVRNYLDSKYHFAKNVFSVSSIPEDWDGLKMEIEKSNLSNRSEILSIINSEKSDNEKDMEMKRLSNYSTLLKGYYPKLRKVDYVINYRVKDFDLKQSRSAYKKNPKDMSQRELYELAMSYKRGSEEFYKILYLAAVMYKKSPTALLNQAIAEVEQGDLQTAKKQLAGVAKMCETVKDNKELKGAYYNTVGAIYLIERDLKRAKRNFAKSATYGNKGGQKNFQYLDKI